MTTQTPARFGTGATNPDDPRNPSYLRGIRDRLAQCASIMHRADAQRAAKRREMSQAQRALDDLRSDLQLTVATDTNGEGKARYSNAESRAAALSKLLRESASGRSIQSMIDGCEVAIAEREQEFETARRERQDLLAVLNFAGQWLSYWSANTTDEG